MRVLVYEHLTATAVPGVPAHLLRQGEAMIRALLADLRALPGVDVVVPPRAEDLSAFEGALPDVDAVWPIAPETGGCLARLSRLTLAHGRLLLNSLPAAVRVAASKRATWQALRQAGVPAIPTCAHSEELAPEAAIVVAKPDDGAGCEHTFVLRRGQRWPVLPANTVFQPWVAGAARSFSMLCGAHSATLLAVNAQRIEQHGDRLRFAGVEPLDGPGDRDALALLAARIHAALPGLSGFVGVDYLDTPAGAVVVEINPRLTTAYVGLSARLGCNVAGRVLATLGVLPVPVRA